MVGPEKPAREHCKGKSGRVPLDSFPRNCEHGGIGDLKESVEFPPLLLKSMRDCGVEMVKLFQDIGVGRLGREGRRLWIRIRLGLALVTRRAPTARSLPQFISEMKENGRLDLELPAIISTSWKNQRTCDSPRRGDCLEDFNSSPYPNVGGVEFEGAESPRDDCSREGCYDDINTYGNTHTKSRAWESAIANTTSKNQSIPASTRVLSLAPWRFEDGPERGDAAQMFHGTCGGGEKLSGFERRISEGRLRGKGFSTHIDSNNIPSPRSYSGNGQAAHSQRPLKYQHRHNWSQNPDRGEREYEQHAASGIWSEKVAWRLGDLTRRFVDDVKRRAKQKPDRAFGDLRQLQLLSSIRDVDSKEVNLKRSSWRESRRQRFLEDGKHRKHFEEGA
ncbi:hypothetical protein R3P38DRAFT_2764060 [Favolaschia claudopus]|uniref:Uncharacterized protein n=1 Tax=Favolaschia claudopus TaxID=2862362 RepID=A0AAW0D9C3_9AGAR